MVDVEHPTKARPQNKNQPTFFFSMHRTMEKFLDDVCKQPPQNSQVVLGVPSLDESTPEQLVNLMQGFADGKHTSRCDYQ